MKSVLVFVLILAACAANTIPADLQDTLGKRPYSRFIEMPDGLGHLHSIDLEEEVDEDVFGDERDGADNEYWLFTRRNPINHQLLKIDDRDSIYNSNFDFSHPVCVLVHGWLSDGNVDPNIIGRETYLGKMDCNVITLDWSKMAQRGYVTSVFAVPGVGKGLGRFLKFLNHLGMPFKKIQMTGLSLGAHVVGAAGRECDGKIARINGLDPAGPLWQFNSNKLSKDAAVYVENIHTDGTFLGIGEACGHVDFFVNGGSNMPGCLTFVCDHMISQEYFFASIKYNHLFGNECSSMLEVRLNTCRGPQLEMGNHHLDKTGSGIYRVNTGRSYPF